MIFPVQQQTVYVASTTTAQSREELEQFIDHLELDFRGMQGQELTQEKIGEMQETLDVKA
jgi:hypothetical protein